MTEDRPLADDLVSPLLHLLQTLRAVCGGDLEKNIILLAVAERTIAHPEFSALTTEERLEGVRPFATKGVNVRSIADSTGIPRETVRRKVAELTRVGWIARSEHSLHFTPEAYRALTPAREGVEVLAVKFHEMVAARERMLPGA